MIPHFLNSCGRLRVPAAKPLTALTCAALACAAALALQGCAGGMPQPKYPIYMQDRPAEPVETGQPAPIEEAPPTAVAPSPSGSVQSTDLAPLPPPPPPPPAETIKPAPAATAAAQPSGAAYVYVMQSKDTLFGVSRRFAVPVKSLYALNGLSVSSALRVGQKILLPASAVDKGVEEHANGPTMTKVKAMLAAAAKPVAAEPARPAAPASSTTSPTAVTRPAVAAPSTSETETKPVAAAKPVVAKPAPVAGFPANAQIAQMGKGKFVWPVKGHVLVPFGQLAPNVRNDGINIGASSGTEVKAASDGIVVYEGDQVKELGNTIYIKHENGWYTGYSHLQSMKVKNNEHVRKGQVIGTVGQTGTIDKPQLHFEIRYTPSTDIARPIDPALVLP